MTENPAPKPSPETPPQAPERSLGEWSAAKLLGLLLLLPAAAMLTVSYILPTVTTIRTSFRRVPATGEGGEPVGTDNYTTLLDGGYLDTFRFALSVMVWPVLFVTIVALVIAYLTNRAGRFARWVIRLALVLPMVALAPTAFAAAWRLDRVEAGEPASEQAAQWLVRGAVALTMFGLLVGAGVTVYLATLRTRERTRPHAATLVAAVLAVLATLAVGLQLYTYPTILSGPDGAAATPLTTVFELGFVATDTGSAAAAATMLLAALAVLGLLAVLLAIATGLRIEVPPVRRDQPEPESDPERPRDRNRPPGMDTFQGTKASARHAEAVFGSILAVVAVLAVAGYGLWPWLGRLFEFRGEDAGQVLVNTWLPPLLGAAIGMVAAALAGFAIGALRPLGRASPLLLLLFAPWLFVGNGVLSVVEYRRYADAEMIDEFASLVPPGWVVVPAVVVFTLLFRGQQARWQELRAQGQGLGTATRRALVLPALPMFWLVGAVTWLVQAQSLIWNRVSARDPDQASGPGGVARQVVEPEPGVDAELAIGMVLPFVVILAFAAGLALLQVTYLDRLAIKIGSGEQQPPAATKQ